MNELKNKIQSKNIFDSLPDDDEKFAKDICKKITYEYLRENTKYSQVMEGLSDTIFQEMLHNNF